MKKLIFTIFALSLFFTANAQQPELIDLSSIESTEPLQEVVYLDNANVDTTESKQESYFYCYMRFASGKRVYLDFGFPKKQRYYIVDEGRRPMKFYDRLSAINFLSYIGWELTEVIADTSGSDGSTTTFYSFIFRKKVKDLTPSEHKLYIDYMENYNFSSCRIDL